MEGLFSYESSHRYPAELKRQDYLSIAARDFSDLQYLNYNDTGVPQFENSSENEILIPFDFEIDLPAPKNLFGNPTKIISIQGEGNKEVEYLEYLKAS